MRNNSLFTNIGGWSFFGCYLRPTLALSFVVVYKATGIVNFATGGSVLLGAYLTYAAAVTWGLPFFFALIVSMICLAILGALMGKSHLTKYDRATGLCDYYGDPWRFDSDGEYPIDDMG